MTRALLCALAIAAAPGARAQNLSFDTEYTYVTGGTGQDLCLHVAVDSFGFAYILGSTTSTALTHDAPSPPPRFSDLFVTKLEPDGRSTAYSVTLGGSVHEIGGAITVDSAGDAFVVGRTGSQDFPVKPATTGRNGTSDAFAVRLDPQGAIEYSTLLGGSNEEDATAAIVDDDGNLYVAGWTKSSDFGDLIGGATPPFAATRAFVTRLDPAGQPLWTRVIGGAGPDRATRLAIAADNTIVLVGTTQSREFPVTPDAVQPVFGGGEDVFLARFGPDGSLLYATYVGGDAFDHATSLALASDGTLYLGGSSFGTSFATTADALYPDRLGGGDAFLAHLDPNGQILWATQLGGDMRDDLADLKLDADDRLYIAGFGDSRDLPTTANAFQPAAPRPGNGFFGVLAPDGSAIEYLTYVGGSHPDGVQALTLDANGAVYLCGYTSSPDFTPPLAGNSEHPYDADTFLLKLRRVQAAQP